MGAIFANRSPSYGEHGPGPGLERSEDDRRLGFVPMAQVGQCDEDTDMGCRERPDSTDQPLRSNGVQQMNTTTQTADRLEYLRGELRAERISYGELAELQALAPHIPPDDVELLEAAGVPEFPEGEHA